MPTTQETFIYENVRDEFPWKYRSAFPAFRVYIYGYDVTDDVLDVRVNHSGGSAERAAGSCSFTLINPFDRYMIGYEDMVQIRTLMASFLQRSEVDLAADIQNALVKDPRFTESVLGILGETGLAPDVRKALLAEKKIAEKEKYLKLLEESAIYISKTEDVKSLVLGEKVKFKSDFVALDDTTILSIEAKPEVFDYPLQQGMCIFHPNDPVRIAFRDPYRPKRWYWMFTGFMDSFTENQDANNQNTVTVTCTDVSKMLRYSLVQLSTGPIDQDIEKAIYALRGGKQTDKSANTKVLATQELFSGFTLFEILEVLFFGTTSAASLFNTSVDLYLEGMTAEERKRKLVEFDPKMKDIDGDLEVMGALGKIELEKRKKHYSIFQLPPVAAPRGVRFKRKNEYTGTHVYYYGEISGAEARVGEKIKNLHWWNEQIHHRVTAKDLDDMLAQGELGLSLEGGDMTAEQIVNEIGTKRDLYPVGGGQVYYLSPSTLSEDLGRNIIDRTLAGNLAQRSEFKDRLSFLYDAADRIDFRCYATPRGDFIFEMPFYDFNPEDFTGISSNTLEESHAHYRYLNPDDYTDEVLIELGFSREPGPISATTIADFQDLDPVDFLGEFVVEPYEQYSFSNTSTDNGAYTVYRTLQKTLSSQDGVDNGLLHKYQVVPDLGLIATLGLRVYTGDTWGFIDSSEAAEIYAAVQLNRMNAEIRNIGVEVTPKFALMVNRPVFWRQKNYYASIVSLGHSIVWSNSLDTTVSLNQVRGWTGEYDSTGREVHRHFSGTDRPFDLSAILKQTKKGKKTQKGGQ